MNNIKIDSSIEAPPQLTPSKNYCDITAYEVINC